MGKATVTLDVKETLNVGSYCRKNLGYAALSKIYHELELTIVVADKASNTSGNVAYCFHRGDGYIFSQTVRGGSKEFKNFVLDDKGYTEQVDKG